MLLANLAVVLAILFICVNNYFVYFVEAKLN